MKALVFVAGLVLLAAALALRAWVWAAAAGLALAAWLSREHRRRLRFAFLDVEAGERGLAFATEPHAVLASRFDPLAVFVEEHCRFRVFGFEDGALHTMLEVDAPQALDLGPGGVLAVALADAVALFGPDGRERGRQPFEPPLFRQSYHLKFSADGRWLLLHTPWFAELFPADLSSPGSRLKYEDAGHYMKYCDLSPDGSALLTGGALLLDDEAGPGIEARWDLWRRGGSGAWEAAWRRSRGSASNSHLRGACLAGAGTTAVLEVYQDGYDFILADLAGTTLWERAGGERPVLDPQGGWVLWENPFEGLTLTRIEERAKAWATRPDAKLRYKALQADGASLVLEGRRFVLRDAQGSSRWQGGLKNDAEAFSAGPGGRFAVLSGKRGALLSLPFGGGA